MQWYPNLTLYDAADLPRQVIITGSNSNRELFGTLHLNGALSVPFDSIACGEYDMIYLCLLADNRV